MVQKSSIIKQDAIYSLMCLTKNLVVKGYEGVDELTIQLNIKNNGNNDWPEKGNIFLICNEKKSDIIAEDIQLIPLKRQKVYSINVIINYISSFPAGIYNTYLDFNVDGKNYGRDIKIIVEILKLDDENNKGY